MQQIALVIMIKFRIDDELREISENIGTGLPNKPYL